MKAKWKGKKRETGNSDRPRYTHSVNVVGLLPDTPTVCDR